MSRKTLEELPLMYLFPTIQESDYSRPVAVAPSNFYQTRKSICFNSMKPISKIIRPNEKIL